MRIIFIFITVLMLLLSSMIQAQESTMVITEPWPPFISKSENGEGGGIMYEIVKETFKLMEKTMVLEFYPWKRCINYMKNKKADALLGLVKTDERELFMFYPKESLFDVSRVFFYKKDAPFTYEGVESLKGKRIGIIPGYNYFEEFDKATNFIKEPAPDFEKNLKKLTSGRIDLFIATKAVGLFKAKKMGIVDEIGFSENLQSTTRSWYLAFSKKKGNYELTEMFNKGLKEFKQTDHYKALLKEYGLEKGRIY